MLGYHFSQWSGLPLPVLICVACSAVLRFLVLSRQACRLGVCFLHVGNGAEPQAGPGLMEGWRGSEAHCHQFLVTDCT